MFSLGRPRTSSSWLMEYPARAAVQNVATVKNYADFIGIIEVILTERRTDLLPKQATVFSTNYDLFVEKAALNYPALRLNDGFSRVPSLDGRTEYASRTFFTTT